MPQVLELDCLPFDMGPHSPLNDPGWIAGWRISSYFGGRLDPITGRPGTHGGQDIVTPMRIPLYAAVSGPCHAGWDTLGGGNWVTIYHEAGSGRIGYGHLDEFAIPTGWSRVTAGTLIGYSGTTGHSTGPHLHFAVDNEDPDTAYNDPYDLLLDAALANRYPSGPLPEVPMSDEKLDAIQETLAKVLNIVAPFGYRDEVDWEMKDQTINGVAMAVRPGITEAGWASRSYLLKPIDSDYVYELRRNATGWYLVHVPGQVEQAVIIKAGSNPHIVELSGAELDWLKSLEGFEA